MPARPPPALSVVIPTRDTLDLTLGCLASLGKWPSEALEVLIVDDASTDGTADAVARRHPGVRTIVCKPAGGFTAAANRGLALAQGELLLLLNSDTEVDPGAFEPLVAAFRGNRRLGIAGASLRSPDGGPQWCAGRAPTLSWLFLLASGLPRLFALLPAYRRLRPIEPAKRGGVDWVTGAAMAIRREAWLEIGPFDESFRFYCQDLDYCLRARAAGWEVEVVTGAKVVHHGGATIGRGADALVSRIHPGLLWGDLLAWGSKRHGRAWAARAATILNVGGALRIFARGLARPFLRASRRDAWDRETEAFRNAREAIDKWTAGT